MNSNKYINKQEFIDNTSKRIPVCIVVDCSGSMALKETYDGIEKSRMQRVNEGIKLFYEGVRNNKKAKRAIDVMIIQVGNDATIISDFSNTEIDPPALSVLVQKCNLTAGVKLALYKLDERKQIYRHASIDYYQPWLLIMSDGGLNEYDNEEFRYIQQIVRNREDEGKLSVFPVYAQEKPKYDKIAEKWKPISKKTYEKRERLMSKFSNIKQRLIYINFSDADEFTRLFQFLHKSASSVANNQGIIIDKNFGNFNQNNNMKIIEKDMYQYDIQEDDVYNIVDNEIELFNTNSNELELEKAKIEQARQKINNTNIEINVSNNIVRKKRFKIDVFVNNKMIFPIRRNEEDKFIFSIKLNKGDVVQLIKNKNDVIYNDTFHYSGTYEFLIYNNGNIKIEIINVNKTSYETIIYEDHNNIDTINKEVEEIMNNITEWDKI